MQVLIACAIGVGVCLAVMIVVMPLGMRVAGRLRKPRADPAQTEESASGPDSVDRR
jgi:hypothetical protein